MIIMIQVCTVPVPAWANLEPVWVSPLSWFPCLPVASIVLLCARFVSVLFSIPISSVSFFHPELCSILDCSLLSLLVPYWIVPFYPCLVGSVLDCSLLSQFSWFHIGLFPFIHVQFVTYWIVPFYPCLVGSILDCSFLSLFSWFHIGLFLFIPV